MKLLGNIIEFICCLIIFIPFVGWGWAIIIGIASRIILDTIFNDSCNNSQNSTETDRWLAE